MAIESATEERRLVHRLLGYWRDVCPSEGFPARADIDPARLSDIWPWCFTISLAPEGRGHAFDFVGTAFDTPRERGLAGVAVSDLAPCSLAQNATYFLDEVLERRVPVSRGGAYADRHGVIRLFRSILLPLGGADGMIDGMLGAANSRPVARDERIVYHSRVSTGRTAAPV